MGGVMVQQKGESWGLTGRTNFCPLKPMRWLQREGAFPYTQNEEGLCILTLGGGGDFNKKDVFVIVIATIVFVVFTKKATYLAVYCWVKMGPATHRKTSPSPRPNGSSLMGINYQAVA
eukprot:9504296-Ditylum_brightwellii.AAC.1